jgi:hypothetical protein
MTWGEAYRLTQQLSIDPSSHVAAALAGWEHPMTREALIAADTYDLTVRAHTPKKRQGSVKPYPRPWDAKRKARMRPTVSQDQVRAALRARGHAI